MACLYPNYDLKIHDWRGREIPASCGVCPLCRAKRVNEIFLRANYEWRNRKSACFVCFTIDDNHLIDFYKPNNLIHASVSKKIWHNFNDRLRHYFKNNIVKDCESNYSYLSCGEYGTKKDSERPHYHALFFGLDGVQASRVFKKLWQYGFVQVDPVENGAIRYVVKYLEKAPKGELSDSMYFDKGIEPPFVVWSKGLGTGLYDEQAENIDKYGAMYMNGKFIPISSYYKNKYFEFDVDKMVRIDEENSRRKVQSVGIAKQFGFDNFSSYQRYKDLVKCKNLVCKTRDSRQSFNLFDLEYIDGFLRTVRQSAELNNRRNFVCQLPIK